MQSQAICFECKHCQEPRAVAVITREDVRKEVDVSLHCGVCGLVHDSKKVYGDFCLGVASDSLTIEYEEAREGFLQILVMRQ